jgi:hypothetical protein
MLSDAERVELFTRVHAAGRPVLDRYTLPIAARYSEWPIAHGTGVLVQIADARFVVTARHVVEEARQGATLYIPKSTEAGIPLRGEYILSGEDRDVGVVRLEPGLADEVLRSGLFEFLRLNRTVPLLAGRLPPAFYVLFGYPLELSRRQRDAIEPVSYWHGTTPHKRTPAELGFDERHHLALRLHRDRSTLATAEGFDRVPLLKGMSGCGIWLCMDQADLEAPDGWSPDHLRLVGIFTGFVDSSEVVKGTIFSRVLDLIRATCPDLRFAIALLRPTSRPYKEANVDRL